MIPASMILRVPFEGFASAVERVLGIRDVYVTGHFEGALVSAGDPGKGTIVQAVSRLKPDDTVSALEELGFAAFEGRWGADQDLEMATSSTESFVAAVAYQSGDGRPGLWLDAFPTLPTQLQVLRTLFDEFRQTGELPEVVFDDFVRLAKPNVIILAPSDVRSFLSQKTNEFR